MKRFARTLQILALAALGGCITDPVTGKSVIGMPTSDAEEEQMGQSYRPVILQQFTGAYPDAALQEYMGSIVLGMAHNSVRPNLPWQFTIVNSSVPNAFAVPGGEVYITRGLLWRLDTEAQFAVVMGHEIGHVEHRHSVQAMARDPIVALLGQQLGERLIGSADAGNLLAGLGVSRFSRDQEREADVQGVHNSYHAGYDPRQGAEVFKKFLALKEAQGGESALGAWTSTHPLDSERIKTIEQLSADIDPRLAGTAPDPDLRVQSGRFAELIAKLRGEEKVYARHDAALEVATKAGGGRDAVAKVIPELTACAKALPNHAVFAATLGRAYAVAGDNANARTWLTRATELHQGLLDPELVLGILALSAKRYDEAAAHAEQGLAILPDNYASLYIRGEANLGLGRNDQAKSDFEAVVKSAPADSSQYKASAEHLGVTAPAAAPKAKSKK